MTFGEALRDTKRIISHIGIVVEKADQVYSHAENGPANNSAVAKVQHVIEGGVLSVAVVAAAIETGRVVHEVVQKRISARRLHD